MWIRNQTGEMLVNVEYIFRKEEKIFAPDPINMKEWKIFLGMYTDENMARKVLDIIQKKIEECGGMGAFKMPQIEEV